MDLRKDIYFYDTDALFPINGSLECLYVDRSSGIIYSWNGTSYAPSGAGSTPTGLNYQGLWDANANSPLITSSVGTIGDYYIVGTAGTTNINGINDWGIGDWIIFSSTGVWQKIDNSEVIQPTIYNADGTVTGTRTVDLDGNTINFNDGKVGVNVTPGFPLQVRGTAIPSAGETVARFDVTDSSAYISVVNGTSTNGVFAPMIQGRQIGSSIHPALQTEGIIDVADDTGTAPVTVFKTRLTGLLQVVTRPVFQFSNWTLDIMTMLANGNVGIGTTTPTEKLDVNGKTKTTTFQMTTTPTAGYVLTSDASGNGSWQLGGSASGVFGIANTSGVYTFYSTLTLAMAAATAGQTIEMFADVTESSVTSITLKNGVNINGNGHTYNYTAATGNCFIDNGVAVTCQISNLKISRTNYTSGSVYIQSSGSSDTDWIGSQINVTAGSGNAFDILGALRNCWVKVIGNGSAIYSAYTSNARFFNCYGESTGSGTALNCRTSTLYNSIGISVSGNAIYGDQSNIYNSTFRSTSGVSAQYGTYHNCNAVCSSSFAFQQCALLNCVGVSTSNAGISSGGYVIRNSTSISGVGVSGGEWYNCHIFTSLSPAVDVSMGIMNGCTIITTWNNALGHAVTTWYGPSGQYVNNYLQIANSSARIFNSASVGTLVYANNTMKGSASPISPNITQATINTQDNQGNILL